MTHNTNRTIIAQRERITELERILRQFILLRSELQRVYRELKAEDYAQAQERLLQVLMRWPLN